MRNKAYTPAQIVNKLRQIERLRSSGKAASAACKRAGVTESVYRRWRKQYGGLVKRVVKLEQDLKTRTSELNDTLEQQAATAEILRVISSSPTDIQPVFDAVAESAARLCDASDVVIRRVDGDMMRMVAHFGAVPVSTEHIAVAIYAASVGGRAILERRTVHVNDILDPHAREDYSQGPFFQRESVGDFRTMLAVPLLRDDAAIGIILIRRPEVRPFSDKQIKLLETFAAQAVIAIENVRLFSETKEALEQQTATAEILRVISSSPTDIQPVFDAILEKAIRLCGAHMGNLGLYDGETYQGVAQRGASAEYAKFLSERRAFRRPPEGSIARMIAERQPIYIADRKDTSDYRDRRPPAVAMVELAGARSYMAVPMLKEGRVVGAIQIYRPEVRPFTQKQIDLVSTFANQAVIAIENVRLFNETKEALEQQTATAEVLKLISRTTFEIQPVLDTLVRSAAELCEAQHAIFYRLDSDGLRPEAWHNVAGEYVAFRKANPIPVSTGSPMGQVALTRQPVHVHDALAYPNYASVAQKLGEWRTVVGVPVLREGELIGTIGVFRRETRPFTEKQVALLKTFADQAVIAIENVRLFTELQARNAEVTESLEQQTATAEILKVISSSPTDMQPVFDAILEKAIRLCDAHMGNLGLYDGETYQNVAQRGASAEYATFLSERLASRFPPEGSVARMIAERQPIHIADRKETSDYRDRRPFTVAMVELGGARSYMAVPMLKEGRVIGGIAIYRPEVRPFTQKQIDLVSTFANQAVIAIENVRLFKELQARNAEVTESLEQQTVTAEILKVIASSPSDVQPVFDAIVKSGVELFGGMTMSLRIIRGDHSIRAARSSPGRDDTDGEDPVPLADTGTLLSRAIARREVVQVADILSEDWVSPSTRKRSELSGFRAYLCAPMLREGRAIGAVIVLRQIPGPFSDKQIALLKTFADQAVIAIENVRLFNETKEALEQQTVISEILRAISNSPTDVGPVFDAIVKSGTRLFRDMDISLRLIRGDHTETAASTYPIDESIGVNPVLLADDRSPASRTIVSREIVQVPDLFAEDVSAGLRRRAEQNGLRALLSAPLLRENTALGAIQVLSPKPGPFSDKQVALLKTFANQAVIAIENVRLFKELQARNAEITESLEQQTATAEILKVISSSPTDIQPVFDAILENAMRLCDAHMGGLRLYDGKRFHAVAQRGIGPEYAKWIAEESAKYPSNSGGVMGPMISDQRPIHILDRRESPDYRGGNPVAVTLVEMGGARTSLGVPMLKEGRLIGAISIHRREVRAFTQKQIDLVSTFANQAVIAIENVRMFKELQARNAEVTESLEQQIATAEILKVIASSPSDVQPVFDAIVKGGVRLFGGMIMSLRIIRGDHSIIAARSTPARDDADSEAPLPLADTETLFSRALARGEAVQVADVLSEDWVSPSTRERAKFSGWRAMVCAPMLRDGRAIGTVNVLRQNPGPFTDKEVALLKTFADQAVIAIENVRLFKELQARNAEVTESLEQQTATAEILKVIASSPSDVQPVFDAILENACRLVDSQLAAVFRYDGTQLHLVATRNWSAEALATVASRFPMPPDPRMTSGSVILNAQVVCLEDTLADWTYDDSAAHAGGWRRNLGVPIMRDGAPIGAIVVGWPVAGQIPQRQVTLLKTFADQAVIAIENVRLFNEIQDKNHQLEVASRHKSEFLASMSHELRTPLNAILGFNEMIIHGLYGEVPPDMKTPLDDIQSSGKHLLRLINNVLDLAKIEAGRMELVLADYSIQDTVESVRSALRPLAAEKGLEFAVTVPDDMPLVYGDSGRIMQCLVNLAGNALKFTKAGKVEILAHHRDDKLTCCVADTGVGIAADKIGSLFTEFKQTDATIAQEYGGTGLGLSITKQFIEMHGGRIWVESEVGQGSRFTFEIPLRATAQAQAGAHA